MSLAAQFTALYRLYYKRDTREAFLRHGTPPAVGLSSTELALLRAVEPARLRRVVDLHAADIGVAWYRPRVGATWLALQAVLEVPEAELVCRLTQSPAFETRVNDDADAGALAAFIKEQGPALAAAPWLGDLLRYEQLLGCPWPENAPPRLERFGYDVSAIREALLGDGLCPTDEPARETWLLLHRGKTGTSELAVRRADAPVIAELLRGGRPNAPARALARGRDMLRRIRA